MSEPISLKNKPTLKELLEKEQVFVPCVWDCISTRAAEMSGFKAVLLSSACVAYSLIGTPDIGLITSNELVAVTERIANTTRLPIIVDADEGYGDSPLMVYRTCHRLAKAGAMAITIDDTTNIRGFERAPYFGFDNGYESGLCSREEFLAKINAAVKGVEGTDCMVIARTAAYMREGMDGAIERMARSEELGAHMTMILGIRSNEEARLIGEKLKGWKMFPDIYSIDGTHVDVDLDVIKAYGFNLVSCHYLEKGAMWGMLDYGKHVFEDQGTAYADDHDMGGTLENGWIGVYEDLSMYKDWLDLEAKFRDEI
jgi:2-methylisocitrate lyase-like PEP mutase family enzyme